MLKNGRAPIRILFVEDSPRDVKVMIAAPERSGLPLVIGVYSANFLKGDLNLQPGMGLTGRRY